MKKSNCANCNKSTHKIVYSKYGDICSSCYWKKRRVDPNFRYECSRCHKVRPHGKWLDKSAGVRICDICANKDRMKNESRLKECSRCSRIAIPARSKPHVLCPSCESLRYYKDNSKHETCRHCKASKSVHVRNEAGMPICQGCDRQLSVKDPSTHKPCGECGNVRFGHTSKKTGKHTCRSCYYKGKKKLQSSN